MHGAGRAHIHTRTTRARGEARTPASGSVCLPSLPSPMAAVAAAVLALTGSSLCVRECTKQHAVHSRPATARRRSQEHSQRQPEPEPEPEPESMLPLTVIVTTSPCRGGATVHCALLRALFASFKHLSGVASTRILLVCDGYKLVKTGGKIRLKGVRFASAGLATGSPHPPTPRSLVLPQV